MKTSWLYSVLPISIASGPVGTLIQLYILQLNGSVIDVGLAITLSSVVSIPAALIWGLTTDRLHKRVPIIVVSYLMVATSLISFLFVQTIYDVDILYAFFSIISSAAATPLNLLIMETQPKHRWATIFARLSMVSGIGLTLGLLLSFAWANFLSLQLLVVPLSMLSVLSGVLSLVLIKEPSFVFEHEVIVMHKRSFHERILATPLIFLSLPRLSDFRRAFKGLKNELTRQIPLLYLSIFAFYISSGLFNSSFVTSLYQPGITKSQVFLVNLLAFAVQTMTFQFAGPYIEKKTLKRTSIVSLILRSFCYSAIGVASYLVSGVWYLGASLILYPIGAGIAYAVYYTASNTMVFNTLGPRGQGSTLGVYSALVGIATTVVSSSPDSHHFFWDFTLPLFLRRVFSFLQHF